MIPRMVEWLIAVVGDWGYAGIVLLMALESSFVPFPSEVVMIPAGYLSSPAYRASAVYDADRVMNLWLAIFCGILGSWIGALVNYYLAVYLGRPFLLKWGRYFLLDEKKFITVERFFGRHGEVGTFTGRLIPVVRQYISFPAGLARMNLARFLFYTGLGAGLWVTVLAWVGYLAAQNEALLKRYSREATGGAILLAAVTLAVYVIFYRLKARRANRTAPPVSCSAPSQDSPDTAFHHG